MVQGLFHIQLFQVCCGTDEEKREKCLSCGVFPLMPYKWEDEDPVLMVMRQYQCDVLLAPYQIGF